VVDLECGTVINSMGLLDAISAWRKSQIDGHGHDHDNDSLAAAEIVGLDASPGMLEVAQTSAKSARAKSGLERVLVRSVEEQLIETSSLGA
jgi:ubiquinone/menaquinone biosynthesis C-methylase UbiE